MIIGIHQPEHFQYLGFFQKMSNCDRFILLDNVKLMEPYFFERLNEFNNYEHIGETRGIGLMAALEMVKNKEISEKEARNHPQRNVITKALGINHNIVPDIHEGKIKTGDKFL